MARAVLTTSISQIAVVGLAFGTSIAQARLLGADGRGDLARFVNAAALATLYLGLGISSAITYFVASGVSQPSTLLRSLRPAFALTVIAVPISFAVVAATPLVRFLPQGLSIGWAILWFTTFFALSQAGSWLSAVLAARAQFTPINSSAVVVGGVGAGASLSLLWLAPSWANAGTIIALTVGLEGLRVLILAVSVRRRGYLGRGEQASADHSTSVSAVTVLQLLRYSGLTFLGDALQFLTYRFDMWVVDGYHGGAELGRYALAVSLAQLVWIVPTATARVLFPYSAMMERSDGALLAWRAARVAVLVSTIVALVGWIGSQFFLTTLFGEEFADVPFLLGILLLGVVPYSIAKVLGTYLAGTNIIGINVAASGAVLVVTIALDLLVIPSHGAVGASWVTAASYTLYTLILFAIFVRRSPMTMRMAFAWHRPR